MTDIPVPQSQGKKVTPGSVAPDGDVTPIKRDWSINKGDTEPTTPYETVVKPKPQRLAETW